MTRSVGGLVIRGDFLSILRLEIQRYSGHSQGQNYAIGLLQAQFESSFSLPPTGYLNPFYWYPFHWSKSQVVQAVRSCTGDLGRFRCQWIKLVKLPCSRRLTGHRFCADRLFLFCFVQTFWHYRLSIFILISQFTGGYNWHHSCRSSVSAEKESKQ